MESVEQRRREWEDNRRRVIAKIREIAAELGGWHMGDNVATEDGSGVGTNAEAKPTPRPNAEAKSEPEPEREPESEPERESEPEPEREPEPESEPEPKSRDPYEVLGVIMSATMEEIKAAYMRLAREWHPDKNNKADKKEAVSRFIEIQKAYELLRDRLKKSNKIETSVTRIAVVKELAAEARSLCEEDVRLLSAFLEEAEALLATRAGVGTATFTLNGLAASVSFLRHTFITIAKVGGGTSRKALLPAAAVAPIRALAGVTAGIGMALDVVYLITSAHSLITNETDQLAEALRQIANELDNEMTAAITAQEKAANTAESENKE